MNVTIIPGLLSGVITPPPSKSQAHRLVIAAALAQGSSSLSNLALSEDIRATLACMRALGAQCAPDGSTITGTTPAEADTLPCLDCGESGSTLRFLIPVALALRGGGIFSGRGRLMERPQGPYETLFAEKDILFARENGTIRVQGKLRSGVFELPGDVSSQFITGLMYALPLLEGDSEIRLTTALESGGYVDMTVQALRRFGVEISPTEHGWSIPGSQHFLPQSVTVESDYSQAGFFCAAVGLGSALEIRGLNPDSAQGDRVILRQCEQLSQKGEVTLDVSQCPDLVPPLAVYAALRDGLRTNLVNAARLRMKESDRLSTITAQLSALGARITEGADFLTIDGVSALRGGTVSGCNDHRIAMMLGIAATRAQSPVTITGAECVAKSYPDFWDDYAALGGRVERT